MGIAHCLGGERIQHIRVVIDEQNGEPLPSVCVTLVGDSAVILKDTSTNGNGWFAINEVSLPEVFVGLSYMGYETQKIAVEHNGSDIDLGQLKLTPKKHYAERGGGYCCPGGRGSRQICDHSIA